MASEVKFGVVGLGIRGFWLSHLISQSEGVKLTAMADLNPQMLDLAREKFPGVALYDSNERMVAEADLEAVLVATSDRFHAINAREALTGGKHVLIEKPLAQSLEDLAEIAGLTQSSGKVVGTFLELRHAPLWRRVRQLLAECALGRVLAGTLVDHVGRDKSQFFGRDRARDRDMMVSLVLQKGVHGLDLLNWFMGDWPCRVSAVGGLLHFGGQEPPDKHCRDCGRRETCPHARDGKGSLGPLGVEIETGQDFCVWSAACDLEDVSFVNLEYQGGAVATYNEVHFAPYYRNRFTLYGDRAQMDIEANHDTGESWIEITERYTQKITREHPTRDISHGNADRDLILDFARAVQEGGQPLCDLAAGYYSAAIGIGTRLSIDGGVKVDIPPL